MSTPYWQTVCLHRNSGIEISPCSVAAPFSTCSLQEGEKHGNLFLEDFMVQSWKYYISDFSTLFHWSEIIHMMNPNFKEGWEM